MVDLCELFYEEHMQDRQQPLKWGHFNAGAGKLTVCKVPAKPETLRCLENYIGGGMYAVLFLSRLCGGELDVELGIALREFLSRLCGGEP